MVEERGFDPEAMLRVLARHEVDFVLIGGVAATLHGSPHVTTDVDVTPAPAAENLVRLSRALVELDARVRLDGVPEGLEFDPAPEMLARVSILNLTTKHGDLDLTFQPTGTGGFADLIEHAVAIEVGDFAIVVASLDDVIRSKEASGREKDLVTLPTLRRLRERLERDRND